MAGAALGFGTEGAPRVTAPSWYYIATGAFRMAEKTNDRSERFLTTFERFLRMGLVLISSVLPYIRSTLLDTRGHPCMRKIPSQEIHHL